MDLHWFEMFQSYNRVNPVIFSPVESDYSVFYLFEQVGPWVRGEDGKRDSIWIQRFGELQGILHHVSVFIERANYEARGHFYFVVFENRDRLTGYVCTNFFVVKVKSFLVSTLYTNVGRATTSLIHQ